MVDWDTFIKMAVGMDGQESASYSGSGARLHIVAAETAKNSLKGAFGLELNAVPADDPVRGTVGIVFWKEVDGREKMFSVHIPVFEKATLQEHKSMESLKKAFQDAVASEKAFIDRCDEPQNLKAGFIAMTPTSRVWHWAELKNLKDKPEE